MDEQQHTFTYQPIPNITTSVELFFFSMYLFRQGPKGFAGPLEGFGVSPAARGGRNKKPWD
jgi:hypothetical protein